MPNETIIAVFEDVVLQKQQKIQDLKAQDAPKSQIKGMTFKIINFRKAIKIIKNFPTQITSSKQLANVKGIGKGIMARIDEILATGGLKDELKMSQASKTKQLDIKNLLRVTGIGPAKANKLYSQGITLEKLLKETSQGQTPETSQVLGNLTHHQYLGVKYFHDVEKRIPRAEIDKINKYLQKNIPKSDYIDDIVICGSYRRGCMTSGDIDLLINYEDIDDEDDSLYTIIKHLEHKGFLIDHLTEKGRTKYMGFCRLKQNLPARRIDIRLIPSESFPAALLYFTGSGQFNRDMRTYALKKGFTLNEYGLFKVKTIKGKQIEKGRKISVKSERGIFQVLGMTYVEPEDRNV